MKRSQIIAVLTAALLNLTLGCNKGTDQNLDQMQKTTASSNNNLADHIPLAINAGELPTSGWHNLGGTVTRSFFVEGQNGGIDEYRFGISPTNFYTSIIDNNGILLGSIELYGTETNAHLEYWTPNDFASIGVVEDLNGIAFYITDYEGTESVAFQNVEEIEQMVGLLTQVYDGESADYTFEEEELIEKGNFWINAVESKTTFIDGELATALEIFSDESIFDDLGENASMAPLNWHCGVRCICAIAAFVALSCLAVAICIPCWVICVPAFGIALTCAAADLISGDEK